MKEGKFLTGFWIQNVTYHVNLVIELNILESFLKLGLYDWEELLSVFMHVSPSK